MSVWLIKHFTIWCNANRYLQQKAKQDELNNDDEWNPN